MRHHLAMDFHLFTQVVELEHWDMVENLPNPMAVPSEPWDIEVGLVWGKCVAGRGNRSSQDS